MTLTIVPQSLDFKDLSMVSYAFILLCLRFVELLGSSSLEKKMLFLPSSPSPNRFICIIVNIASQFILKLKDTCSL